MSKRIISDSAMREACGVVRNKMLDSMKGCEVPVFSDDFQDRMQQLDRRAVHAAHLRSVVRKSIAAVLALIICLAAFLTFSPEARANVIEHYKQIFPGQSWYWFRQEGETAGVRYAPTWLPEGYELVNVQNDPYDSAWQTVTYQCAGDTLCFQFAWLGGGNVFSVQTEEEYTDVVSVSVNGLPGDLYISAAPDQAHYLVWVDEEEKMLFCISAHLDTEVMLHIAESVCLED